ncbi:MAG: dephospho-CoA kinase [Clostridia bacterium]|nr:dephospho-CoA kinase [Clostridia bacterium]
MKVLGLCGGSGAGKGFVCEVFSTYGIPAIDTDAVYHKMTEAPSPCTRELESVFGSAVIRENGSLDRRALAAIVFAPDGGEKLKKLNEITHKYIKTETVQAIERYQRENKRAVIVDAPALFESGFDRLCDCVIGVFAPRETRIRRIMERDGITAEHAEARIAKQIPDGLLEPRCDYCIYNGGEDVKQQVEAIIFDITE